MVTCTKHFDYPFASIGDLEVRTMTDPKSGRTTATEVIVDGESVMPTDRFWLSLYCPLPFQQELLPILQPRRSLPAGRGSRAT